MRRLLIWVAAAAILVGLGWLASEGQQRLRAERAMLPVTFAHLDHRSVNCVACHHNFVDQTGQGLCFQCHKTNPEISTLIETQFHTLCRDCHVEKQAEGEDGGPTRRCLDCHTTDDAP